MASKLSSLIFFAAVALLGHLLHSPAALARDSALLNQAVTDSISERADVERQFKTDTKISHAERPRGISKSIAVELGDGLGGGKKGNSDRLKLKSKIEVYREHAVAAKLDREWRDVKNSLSQAQHSSFSEKTKKSAAQQQLD